MKFAKTLEEEEVPEWQDNYFNYKLGKKKIKAVSRAINGLPDLRASNSLRSIQEVDTRRDAFFAFLDDQLNKVNAFFRAEELEAERRTNLLREQLHTYQTEGHLHERLSISQQILTSARLSREEERPNTDNTNNTNNHLNPQRDYTRRPDKMPSPSDAKRKLKAIMQEEYRHLELIRAFSDMNRTAFRKILKKYMKETGNKTGYMDEKVNKAYFVTSDEIQKLVDEYEQLYAEHFEKDNRKAAASKLRAKNLKAVHYIAPSGRAGFAFGAALVLALIGIVNGTKELFGPEPFSGEAVYLLQFYGGYFLIVFMAALIVVDFVIFNKFRINYGFIFELDPKSALSWYQMAEMIAWLFLLFSVTFSLNMGFLVGGYYFYKYWFVVLVVLTALLLGLPAPIFYHRSRKWLAFTVLRQLAPGVQGVEFRDFFGGDLLCSLTYAIGNIYLFSCVYANNWREPSQCNSGHAWGLGALTCLPGLIRALQCLRRFWDEKAPFPHLVNFGKYCCTIGQYAFLCVYRLNVHKHWSLGLFAAAASVNSIYCIIWDILYDWSLGNPRAKYWGLRDTLVFRKHAWVYYVAIVIDIILRLNWIPYCIWTKDVQHASIVSWIVGFSEVFRRGVWAIFRIENEHATNIVRHKAVRDMVLPYKFSSSSPSVDGLPLDNVGTGDLETQGSSITPAMSTLSRIGTRMRTGHMHDYTRKRRTDTEESWREEEASDEDD